MNSLKPSPERAEQGVKVLHHGLNMVRRARHAAFIGGTGVVLTGLAMGAEYLHIPFIPSFATTGVAEAVTLFTGINLSLALPKLYLALYAIPRTVVAGVEDVMTFGRGVISDVEKLPADVASELAQRTVGHVRRKLS